MSDKLKPCTLLHNQVIVTMEIVNEILIPLEVKIFDGKNLTPYEQEIHRVCCRIENNLTAIIDPFTVPDKDAEIAKEYVKRLVK